MTSGRCGAAFGRRTYYEVPAEYGVKDYRYTVVNNCTVLVDQGERGGVSRCEDAKNPPGRPAGSRWVLQWRVSESEQESEPARCASWCCWRRSDI